MILTARLYIQGHQHEDTGIPLLSCDFQFEQDVDQRGLPISEVRGGIINMAFNSTNDEELISWMMSAVTDKNGKIVFSETDASRDFKTLEFEDARCIRYRESFTRDSEMIEEITISARVVILSGVHHYNFWSGYSSGN